MPCKEFFYLFLLDLRQFNFLGEYLGVQGMRGSVFKSVLLNPLVWIGLILTGFTLHYEGYSDAFKVFFQLETYRNLAIGAAIYVALFNRQYKKGGGKLDIAETLAAVVVTMYIILLVWGISLFAVVNYHLGGLAYSDGLRQRYKDAGWIQSDDAAEDAEALREFTSDVVDGVEFEKGKTYRVIPQSDGSMIIEVVAE